MADPQTEYQAFQLPQQYPAVAVSANESTAASLATDGVACREATIATCAIKRTNAIFTSYDVIFEVYGVELGWEIISTESIAADIDYHKDFAIETAMRVNFRLANVMAGGGWTADRHTSIGRHARS